MCRTHVYHEMDQDIFYKYNSFRSNQLVEGEVPSTVLTHRQL